MFNDGGACANVLPLLRSDLIAAGYLTSIKKNPVVRSISLQASAMKAHKSIYIMRIKKDKGENICNLSVHIKCTH